MMLANDNRLPLTMQRLAEAIRHLQETHEAIVATLRAELEAERALRKAAEARVLALIGDVEMAEFKGKVEGRREAEGMPPVFAPIPCRVPRIRKALAEAMCEPCQWWQEGACKLGGDHKSDAIACWCWAKAEAVDASISKPVVDAQPDKA
jgi:hypothetical protein